MSPGAQVAIVEESRCIGCARCREACPVDAIAGAEGFLHAVVTAYCTGCELCVAPCPVDCIRMVAAPADYRRTQAEARAARQRRARLRERAARELARLHTPDATRRRAVLQRALQAARGRRR